MQRVTDIINVSGRNRFCATTPETESLTVLEAFRDLDIHRVFVRYVSVCVYVYCHISPR